MESVVMDLDKVKDFVEALKKDHYDDERAHSEEDLMYLAFIRYCASFAPSPFREIAEVLVTTQEIDFAR